MISDASVKIDRYTVSKQYNLNHNNFETIICRLVKEDFIPPRVTTEYDHRIMLETKGKIN